MKRLLLPLLLLTIIATQAQQKVLPLYNGTAPGSENWNWNEAENDSNAWKTKVVYNVSKPTLNVFLPDVSAPATGTAVIICPGGYFHALAINKEGYDVANWLTRKGITCFVLKYRVVHSLTSEPVKEITDNVGKPEFSNQLKQTIPLCIADGKAAIAYVRQHASEYNIKPDQIGIMGFSAGGTVAASAAFNYTAENKPDFVAPVYAYMPPELMDSVLSDAPPMFITAASDDNLGLAPHSVNLYNKWLNAKKPVELHLYVKGSHGFGMHQQNIPTDTWIDRFGDWLNIEGFIKGNTFLNSQQVANMQKTLQD